MPTSDRDAEGWLRRGAEAATQGDWKLAADTLMRVMDQFGDRTVSPDDGQHYFSAARCALDQIRDWPEEGMATYRRLFDPEVKQRLATAKKNHDIDALRQIARRFPYTTQGPEAAHLLAAWLIDRREASEAIDLLNELLERPHPGISTWQIQQKLCIAYTLEGDFVAATELLNQLRPTSQPTSAPDKQPDDISQRIAALATLIESTQTQRFHAQGGASAWPCMLGPASSMGRMSPVDPAVSVETAQREILPGAGRFRTAALQRIIKRTGRVPVWQLASDGRSIFATTPEGLLALDLGSFDVLWKSIPKRPPRDPRIERQRMMMGMMETDNSDRLDEATTNALYHEYRGIVSTALGLVFTIEQAGTPNEQFPTKEGTVAPNNTFIGDEITEPNSLRAFDAQTGKAAWTKGRGGPVEDGLRNTHFLSTPVQVGDKIVALMQVAADLQLAVLSPDGQLQKSIMLGTGQPGMFPLNGVLPITVHEGTIYVPTGAGMLIALSAHDFSLRWQTPYERSITAITRQAPARQLGPNGPATGGLAQPDEWLACPPLVVSGLVILAANDSEWLLAFERHSGQQKWVFPRGLHRYLVGADGHRVLLAGKSILALDAATGRGVWSFDKAPIMGRPALCGDALLVPTDAGLIRLNATTGERIGDLLPTDQLLGNLFALDGALYSISGQTISKFSDIERSREIGQSILQKNPNDKHSLLRLAQLASLKKDWKQALTLLERADTFEKNQADPAKKNVPDDTDLLDRIRHHHVAMLLNIAGQSPPEEQSPLLKRAEELALRPDDRVQAMLASFDLQRERKDHIGAYRTGLELLARHGDQPLVVEDNLLAPAAMVIGERLASIWGELAKNDRLPIEQEAERQTESDLTLLMSGRPDLPVIERLIRMSDVVNGGNGASLDLALGKNFYQTNDQESACYFLRRAASRASLNETTRTIEREARLRLIIALAYPTSTDAAPTLPATNPLELTRLINEFRKEAGEFQLPINLPQCVAKSSPKSVNEILDQITQRLPSEMLISRDGANKSRLPQVLHEARNYETVAQQEVAPGPGFTSDVRSFFDPAHPTDIFSTILPVRIMRQIKGLGLNGDDAGKADWSTLVSMAIEDIPGAAQTPIDLTACAAAFAGPVAVLDCGTQICAVGMSTGRMLWPPIPIDRTLGPLPEPSLLQIGDNVIVAIDASTLMALPARPGARPIWRRQWPSKRLRLLTHIEGMLVAVDRESSQVTVVDPATGRIRRQFTPDIKNFVQGNTTEPEKNELLAPLAVNGRALCYAVKRGVAGRDVLTGQPIWERPEPAAVIDIRALDDRHVAVSLPNMIIEIIRVDSGEVVRTITLEGMAMPPLEYALDWYSSGQTSNGRLTVFSKTSDDQAQFVLQSFSMEKDGSSWRRELGKMASMNRHMLRASPDYITAVQYTPNSEARRQTENRGPIDKVMLAVFDKVSGRPLIDEPWPIRPNFSPQDDDGSGKLIRDVIVMDQRIVVVSPKGYYVLAKRDGKQKDISEPDESQIGDPAP